MKKKDFELIAGVFRERKPQHKVNRITWLWYVEKMADKLQNTNPLFNRERFLKACGIEK